MGKEKTSPPFTGEIGRIELEPEPVVVQIAVGTAFMGELGGPVVYALSDKGRVYMAKFFNSDDPMDWLLLPPLPLAGEV